jgi:4-hydroxy 2-oxovalerate aldolase
MTRDVTVLDVSLRDSIHSVRHSFTEAQVRAAAKGFNAARVRYFEVSHGEGLGCSSLQYGFSATDELKLIEAAAEECTEAEVAVLLIPGIGTKQDLQNAANAGAKMVRVATHVTEADVAAQHIQLGRELGMKTAGFLLMAHMAPVEIIVEQAKLFESYGAELVYVADSAGAMLPHDVRTRITALKQEISCEIGFHAHNKLSMALANTIAAVEAGATFIDGSMRALGAGAGNSQTEVIVTVLEKLGYKTGVDLYHLLGTSNGIITPLMQQRHEGAQQLALA